MAENEIDLKAENTHALVEKLSAVGWGLFFIWLGIAFLTGLSWGAGLVGVGVIAIGGEAARRYFGIPVNWFWLIMGMIFVVWGVCESLGVKFSGALLPLVSIAIGVAILVAALRPKRGH